MALFADLRGEGALACEPVVEEFPPILGREPTTGAPSEDSCVRIVIEKFAHDCLRDILLFSKRARSIDLQPAA